MRFPQAAPELGAASAGAPLDTRNLGPDALANLWHTGVAGESQADASIHRALAERALGVNEPLLAHDIVEEGLQRWPEDVRLRELQAVALAQSGAAGKARTLLESLLHEGWTSDESNGTLATLHRDLWAEAPETEARAEHLAKAAELFEQAYRQGKTYWAGINCAVTRLLLGDREAARTVARRVREQLVMELAAVRARGEDSFWHQAALGDASLILGRWSEAERWYTAVAEASPGRYEDLSAARRNARTIIKHSGADKARFERVLKVPKVAVFVGHLLDRLDRVRPRFPPRVAPAVGEAVLARMEELGVRIGYASASCGSDLLFLEALATLKGETHLVLPYTKEQFLEDSVKLVSEGGWPARFEVAARHARRILIASHHWSRGNSSAYLYAKHLLLGLASLHARRVETELVAVAVWDGEAVAARGGTSDTIARWRARGNDVYVIDLAAIRDGSRPRQILAPAYGPMFGLEDGSGEMQVRAFLVADAAGFSRLREVDFPSYVERFLAPLVNSIGASGPRPLSVNMWGDRLFLAFESVRDAGVFAQALWTAAEATPPAERPAGLDLRITLHAGPVFTCRNPLTRQIDHLGEPVRRAGRIDAPPGQVYASEEFAALAAADAVNEFTCVYVGRTTLTGRHSSVPLYHVRAQARPAVEVPQPVAVATAVGPEPEPAPAPAAARPVEAQAAAPPAPPAAAPSQAAAPAAQAAPAVLRTPDEELEHLQQAVAAEPGSASLRTDLARAYMAVKDYEHAVEHLQRAVALAPRDVRALAHLTEVYLANKKLDEAEPVFQRLLEMEGAPDSDQPVVRKVYQLQAEACIYRGRLDAAATLLERLVALEPRNPQHRAKLAFVRKKLGAAAELAAAEPTHAASPAAEPPRPVAVPAPPPAAAPAAAPPAPRVGEPDVPGGSVEKVHYSVTAPASVAPGSSFHMDVWAAFEGVAPDRLKALQDELAGQMNVKAKGPLMPEGPMLYVRLKLDGLEIEDRQETVVWYGEVGKATFAVAVPEKAAPGLHSGVATIHVIGLRIARVEFVVNVGPARAQRDNLPVQEYRHQKAFASYVAPDIDDVQARVLFLAKAAPQLQITVNVISLRQEPEWEKGYQEKVPAHDVFYLFWSRNAMTSPWVEKEWRSAVGARGLDFVDPVPLQSPHSAPPPTELAAGRFGDWILAFRSGPAGRVVPGF